MAMLPKVERVLAATDFSTAGDASIAYAYSLVAAGGVVNLLHVIEQQEPPTPCYAYYATEDPTHPRNRRTVLERVKTRLQTLIPQEARDRQIDTFPKAVVGANPAECLLREATRVRAQVIVLGAHGHTLLDPLLIGSVAGQVLPSSPVPVLIVPCAEWPGAPLALRQSLELAGTP